MDRKNLRVVVVCGGISSEREISLRSGRAILGALLRLGYENAAIFDLTKENLETLLSMSIDLAYLALHGEGGEDGYIQGLLELAGIPYTGSRVEASATCMNKIHTKQILESQSLPTPSFIVKHQADCKDLVKIKSELIEALGLPLVLKSPCQGSSIGVVIVRDKEEMEDAIREVFSFGDQLLAEKFMAGRELTLPILGGEELLALPVVEITSERDFYDFEAKYTEGLFHHIIPARISTEQNDEIVELGKRAYRALGCRGLIRIDFMMNEKGNPSIIEVNTIPGMTETSLVPDSARSMGISFDELIDRIVSVSLV